MKHMKYLISLFVFLSLALSLSSSSLLQVKTDLPQKAEDISPLLTGEQIPDVQLMNMEGEEFRLQDEVSKKPSVLIFYRGGWCPFCNRQLAGLEEVVPQLKELGYQILAISPDPHEKLAKTLEKQNLSYRLYSDPGLKAAQEFGIVFQLDDKTVKKYKTYKIELQALEEGVFGMPVPTVMILDKKGSIQFEYINPNYKVRLDPELLLKAAEVSVSRKK